MIPRVASVAFEINIPQEKMRLNETSIEGSVNDLNQNSTVKSYTDNHNSELSFHS